MMGEKTGISWTDKTHNFWYGCHKVSAGCKACYAEREMKRYGKDFGVVTKAKGFGKPVGWKEPAKVFVNSWSDFFVEEADLWRAEAWDVIYNTPHLTYQILTKRPERIAACLPRSWEDGYSNVWLGVTAENQEMADLRVPLLLKIPARVRFLSCEPLLGAINLRQWLCGGKPPSWGYPNDLHWVIVGGESGKGCRTMDLQWARDIQQDCYMSGVPVWFKQQSGIKPGTNPTLDGVEYKEFPE